MNLAVEVTCPCGAAFATTAKRIELGRGKFCSRPCMYRFRSPRPSGLKYEKHKENPTSFKPGHKLNGTGPEHPNWKGEEVGYRQLHDWVRSQRPYPDSCEWCDRVVEQLSWANISHEYKRDIKDWAARSAVDVMAVTTVAKPGARQPRNTGAVPFRREDRCA